MTLSILKFPNPALRAITQPVQRTSDIENEVLEVANLLKETGGLGLAAPQVGLTQRFFVANVPGEMEGPVAFINPGVLKRPPFYEVAAEQCLSIPGVTRRVRRNKMITLAFQDLDGVKHTVEATGLLARVIQHELDHLNGILIIDY